MFLLHLSLAFGSRSVISWWSASILYTHRAIFSWLFLQFILYVYKPCTQCVLGLLKNACIYAFNKYKLKLKERRKKWQTVTNTFGASGTIHKHINTINSKIRWNFQSIDRRRRRRIQIYSGVCFLLSLCSINIQKIDMCCLWPMNVCCCVFHKRGKRERNKEQEKTTEFNRSVYLLSLDAWPTFLDSIFWGLEEREFHIQQNKNWIFDQIEFSYMLRRERERERGGNYY